MNRRSVTVFSVLSLLVALLAAASVAYRVLEAEAEGKRAAETDFDRLSAMLAYVRVSNDLASPALRASLSNHYDKSPNLLVAAVYERGSGMRWRIPADSEYLPAAENQKPVPTPSHPDRSSLLLSSPLEGDVSGKLTLTALYSTLPQGKVFQALRDAILLLGLYLAAAAAILAIAAAAKRGAPAEAAPPVPKRGAYEPIAGRRDAGEDSFQVPELMPELMPAPPPAESARVARPRPAEAKLDRATPPPPAETGEAPPAEAESRTGGLYSPSSGLGWEQYLPERLDAEIARSASFEQDLSLLVISYADGPRGSPGYPEVAKSLREFFTFRDLAFERGEDGFTVILPNIGIDAALRMSEEFLKKLTFQLRAGRGDLEFLPLFMGLSSRSGRLVDADRLAQEAAAALQKAIDDRDTHIVAFRPDPDKYRLFLASKGC